MAASRRRMTRRDVEVLISDGATPDDRRVFYALLSLTGARMSEGAALRWCDVVADKPLPRVVIAEQWHQRLKERRGTKTGRGREVPLHPQLAAVLEWWKATGWEGWYGRAPEPADLIVPARPSTPAHRGQGPPTGRGLSVLPGRPHRERARRPPGA